MDTIAAIVDMLAYQVDPEMQDFIWFNKVLRIKGARISDRIGHSRLKSGRIGPDNIPDFPENPDLSGF